MYHRRVDEDPEARRIAELLDRITRGELTEAEAEEIELYAEERPELRAEIEARRQQAALGGGWLARVVADHALAKAERSPRVLLERAAGAALVVAGLVLLEWSPAALVLGLGVLVFSFLRVNHRHDPYKDIQR